MLDSIGSKGCIGDIESFKLHLRSTNISYLRFHIVLCVSVEWTRLDLRDASGDIESYSNFISGQENINCVSTLSQIKKKDISTLSQIKKTFIVNQCLVLSGLDWI